jgi:acid phosphatase type 7
MRPATCTGAVACALAFAFAFTWPASASASAARPEILRGPYLTALTDAQVEVRFELDVPAVASVELVPDGADGGSPGRTVVDALSPMHVVRIGDLEPGKAYAYSVRAGGAVVGSGRFTTAPPSTSASPSAGPTTFLVYGDTRSDDATHAAIVRQLRGTPADFLVNTGDAVAEGGRPADWQSFFQIEAPLLKDRAVFFCIGNHELVDDAAGAAFARYFGFTDARGTVAPYGTTRWGSVRFFFLNGMHDWQSGEERQWLERELTHADTEPGLVWRVAVVHHGPWSSGPHGSNGKLLSARVPELLEQHHVDLVLSGHDHIYERGQVGRLAYVVSGGGGAPLYPIKQRASGSRKVASVYHFVEVTASTDAIHIVARAVDGTVLDSCGLPKGGSWDCDAGAPAGSPPGTPPSSSVLPASDGGSSRCGCRVPGDASSRTLGTPGLLAVLAALSLRRRRSRQA